MFQLLKSPDFNFMGHGKTMLVISGIVVLASCIVLATIGLNMGIEFTGGTELQLKYSEKPDLTSIRSTLQDIGIRNSVVTTIGDPADNEIYIRLGVLPEGDETSRTDDATATVVRALLGDASANESDLNILGSRPMARLLGAAPGLSAAEGERIADEILADRRERALFTSLDDVAGVPGMTPEIMDYLRAEGATVGPLSIRSQSYIGPTIGRELKRKAGLAILGSLLGMLLYIWVRFELQWGFAAVAALFHDTIITLGLVSIFQKELSLPVVAAFLTLVGYSVNDTVVVFDRIRENLRKQRGSLQKVVNNSINQTLSRTIITSGLTLVVVVALLFFGGAALNPFAFVLTMGVLVGTYSSIFIASPIVVLLKRAADKRQQRKSAGPAGPTRRVKKVSPSSAS